MQIWGYGRSIEPTPITSYRGKKAYLSNAEQSIELSGEDFNIRMEDLDKNILLEIDNRIKDIKKEKSCLIEFDDHILTLK
ncbi:MAG: hypothetical protein ABR502_01545 [Chitinophagaceae bacterium]